MGVTVNTKKDRSIDITKDQLDLIIGTTLGDGTITKSRNERKTAAIRFTHSDKQEVYFVSVKPRQNWF